MSRKKAKSTTSSVILRKNDTRGLPDEQALFDLAGTYLDLQHQHWPELASQGLLPPNTPEATEAAAEGFRQRFIQAEAPPVDPACLPCGLIGAAYLRYSCDNSNPRSLAQQLRNVLDRARRENAFIPWAYVFADAAVTGTVASRRGYELAKQTLGYSAGGPQMLFFDELGRAGRDTIENLKLGRYVESLGKHLIGVTDGIDSRGQQWKMMLTFYGMLNEAYVDQLREKVDRGMSDAFRQGRNLHSAPFGYKLEPVTDGQGSPQLNSKGKVVQRLVIDEEAARYVREVFELYAERKWSLLRIARHLNRLQVAGRTKWHVTNIRQILRRRTYIGIECYGMTRQVRDPETGRMTVHKLPEEQWKKRESPHLRIVSQEMWDKAQQRLQETGDVFSRQRQTQASKSRVDVYPRALFRPICGSCGTPLHFGKSGTGASFCCRHGLQGANGCTTRSYKSIRIIENCLLAFLRDRVFTQEFLQQVLQEANQYLKHLAAQPPEDLAPRQQQLRELRAKRDKLVELLDSTGAEGLAAVVEKIRGYEQQIERLQVDLHEQEARQTAPPSPLQMTDLEGLLVDLRDLLNEATSEAAPILAELVGPVVVNQVQETGRKKPTWIATVRISGADVLVRLAAGKNIPTASTWEYLSGCGWKLPATEFQVRLEELPKAIQLAPLVQKMHAQGMPVQRMAHELGCARETIESALNYLRTGELWSRKTAPLAKKRKKRPANDPAPAPKYQRFAAEVAHLRDTERLPLSTIAKNLGIDRGIALQAYRYFHSHLATSPPAA